MTVKVSKLHKGKHLVYLKKQARRVGVSKLNKAQQLESL